MQVLRVMPNPFVAFDRDGDPCAVVPRDPDDGGGPLQFVGARLDRERTKKLQDFGRSKFGDNERFEIRSAKQSTKYSYMGVASDDRGLAAQLATKDPIDLPSTKYYKARLKEGSLIPADEATAKRVGLQFVPVAVLFAGLGVTHARPEPEKPAEIVPSPEPSEATPDEDAPRKRGDRNRKTEEA